MIKTVREKLLENRIARLEKLIMGDSKRSTNESLPRSGMTFGNILKMLMGTRNMSETLDDIESMTDIHFQVADEAGLADEVAGLEFISDHWDDICRVSVEKGMGGGGSDDVKVSVAGITLGFDWIDEEAYESRKQPVRRTRR